MKKLYKSAVLILFLFWGFQPIPVQAQDSLQSPSDFLGYELGSEWTTHNKVMDYFRHVADASPLVRLEQYGESNEGRELILTTISGEQNLNRLEEIRTENLRRAGLAEGESSGDKTAIVWLSYNVHGNETSSSEAAMKTIYELVRPDNEESKQWLQNTVVLIDPMLNPDGRDRYVHWYKQTAGSKFNAHIDAREHHEPWPGGRTNHYYFDLNRDWAWLTQKETRQRVEKYQEWMPHIHVDFHEQSYNSPYYFAPAAEPFHEAITDWQREFQYSIGENHARYFNANNWLFFTREVFDLFYPSYGDTYPIFNGAIGMTYEQAGNSRAGLGIITSDGDTLTLKDRLTHHHTTGMSTVEISSGNAERLVDEFSAYFQTARNDPQGEYKTFVIKGDNNPGKLHALFDLLDHHQIEYGKASRSQSLDGYNYETGSTERVQVTTDDYLVSVFQPKAVLARVLFEPRPQLSDSVTYDITAWEQHYAYGLDGYALTERLSIEPAPAPQNEVENPDAGTPYAYLVEWKDMDALQFLANLLNDDMKVRFASKKFTLNNREYDPGTLIITRGDNKVGNFDRKIRAIANRYNQNIETVETGLVQAGTDFGSSSVRFLKKPKVAVLSGSGTSSYMVGEIWHYFDRQIGYPVTLIDTGYFNDVELGRYDVLILPSGNYNDTLSDDRLKDIRNWISGGGKLIALQGANSLLAGKEGFNIKEKKQDIDVDENDTTITIDQLDIYSQRQRENISNFNAGSIFKVTMDNSHPLAFGYEDSYFSLKLDADAYRFLDDGWNVGVAAEDAHMSGFVGYKAKEGLKNTLAFGVQDMGSGEVIYMVDNPLFRAFWYNGKLLFGNAVFLVGQ